MRVGVRGAPDDVAVAVVGGVHVTSRSLTKANFRRSSNSCACRIACVRSNMSTDTVRDSLSTSGTVLSLVAQLSVTAFAMLAGPDSKRAARSCTRCSSFAAFSTRDAFVHALCWSRVGRYLATISCADGGSAVGRREKTRSRSASMRNSPDCSARYAAGGDGRKAASSKLRKAGSDNKCTAVTVLRRQQEVRGNGHSAALSCGITSLCSSSTSSAAVCAASGSVAASSRSPDVSTPTMPPCGSPAHTTRVGHAESAPAPRHSAPSLPPPPLPPPLPVDNAAARHTSPTPAYETTGSRDSPVASTSHACCAACSPCDDTSENADSSPRPLTPPPTSASKASTSAGSNTAYERCMPPTPGGSICSSRSSAAHAASTVSGAHCRVERPRRTSGTSSSAYNATSDARCPSTSPITARTPVHASSVCSASCADACSAATTDTSYPPSPERPPSTSTAWSSAESSGFAHNRRLTAPRRCRDAALSKSAAAGGACGAATAGADGGRASSSCFNRAHASPTCFRLASAASARRRDALSAASALAFAARSSRTSRRMCSSSARCAAAARSASTSGWTAAAAAA
eukprot:Rhum_TRINITY_DN14639_c39_g1::Rhum_TRINITY_DN14639_c39_g1_i1::g.106865::m.106865